MQDASRGSGPVLIGVLLALGMSGTVFVAWWLPRRAIERRARNERAADLAIHQLASAQLEFRRTDADGNGIPDYWTGDVLELGRLGLIDRGIAHADLRPIRPSGQVSTPASGYYYIAMDVDESETPPEEYRQDTDGKRGRVHHLGKFAFCAFPADYGTSGRATFIINQDMTAFKNDTGGKPALRWPADSGLMLWGKYQ